MKLRSVAIGLAIPLSLPVQAQIFNGPIAYGLQILKGADRLPQIDQGNPTQPTGFPTPPVKRAGDLPLPGPEGPDGGSFQLIDSGKPELDGSLIHVTGGVEFTDRGYHCWADELFGDRRTDTYTLKGNVRVLGQDESVYGDLVQVNFTKRTFVADDTEDTLKPNLVRGQLRDNLYVKSHHSYGSRREVWAESTSTTTCSYPDPHFEIVAERTDVRPGRRIIFRKAKIRILGRTILNIPFLSIPLDERTYNNLPEVGHGTQEGYFIKNRYSFPVSDSGVFRTRLDYFSKLGTGLGGGYKFDTPYSRGLIDVYTIQGPHKELDITGQLRQNLRWGMLTVDSSYQDDNYQLSTTSKILNTRVVLFIPQGRSSNRVTFFRTSSDAPGASSTQQTVSINDTRYWNNKLNTTFDVNYSDNTTSYTGGQPIHREQIDTNFRAVDDLDKAQARFDYVRSIPIGESSNFFTTSDVTPSLTFLSDSRRLFGQKFDTKFPFQTQLSYGEYGDPLNHGRVTRNDFDFNFQNPRGSSGKHWDLQYQGEFKQDLYSDDTAQYVLRTGTQLTYNFHNSSRIRLQYSYLRPEGFTPLQIDRRGQTNNFLADMSYSPFKHFLLGAATGYDFLLTKQHQPTPWQQVGLRAEYTLGKTFSLRALSTYDTIQHAYSSTRLDMLWIPGSTYVSVGAKYDGLRNKWAAANLFIDGFKIGRLRTSVLLNYNGYLNHFDAEHYSFIYDLHCAEAVLQIIDNPTGFNGGRQIYFFIRLKALPFDTPFGTGNRGQPIGTGTGRDF